MKQTFLTKRFNTDAAALIVVCNTILADYEREGYDLSLRQLYYQLVARNIVPNTEKSYKRVGEIVSDARLAGLIDWSMIQDRGRITQYRPHWTSPSEILRASAEQFRIDLWEHQPNHIEVMVEKQALEGVLIPVCEEMDVRFCANKGYSSSSALYETGARLLWMRKGKPRDGKPTVRGKNIIVIYLGDHDPSGIDMTRDVRERLEMFSRGPVEVIRVALNMAQIDELQPPENPAKMTDSRAADYVAQFGDSSWELDAIEPRALATLVRDAIQGERDQEEFEDASMRQQKMKDELAEMADKYDDENQS